MKPCTPPSVLALRGQAPEPSPGSETTKPHAAWHSSIVQSPCSPEALGSSDGHVGGFASSGQDGAAGESSTRDGVSTRDTCADDASRPSISARMAAPCPALLSAEDRASGWSEGPSTVCRVFSQPTSCMASHSQHAWHPTRFTRSPYRSCGVIASVVTQATMSRVSWPWTWTLSLCTRAALSRKPVHDYPHDQEYEARACRAEPGKLDHPTGASVNG